jgi:hypothetical protein
MATSTVDTREGQVRPALSGERRFYTIMAAIVLISTFVGFAPSYYLRFVIAPPHPFEPLTPLVFIHGLVFSSWVMLFAVQTMFVAGGRIDLHRRLGTFGFALILVMIPLALAVAIGGIARPLTAPPGIAPLSWVAVPLLDVPLFAGLILAALANRRRPLTHKRLMMAAMVDMLRPSLGRLLPMLGFGGPLPLLGPLVFLLPLIGWDLYSRGRVHPATMIGAGAVAAVTIATPLVWETQAWLMIAAYLAALA